MIDAELRACVALHVADPERREWLLEFLPRLPAFAPKGQLELFR